MTLKSVATLTIFFVLVFEASGQLSGIVGSACTSSQQCLDNGSHVCDNSTGSPLCKIKAGKFCGRQITQCVSGASCQDVCVCATGALSSGLCNKLTLSTQQAETTTPIAAAATTTTTTTTMAATTEEADDMATTTDSSQSARKKSGAVTWTCQGLSHVIQMLAAILLCLLSP